VLLRFSSAMSAPAFVLTLSMVTGPFHQDVRRRFDSRGRFA
jgi:hypothetical protein